MVRGHGRQRKNEVGRTPVLLIATRQFVPFEPHELSPRGGKMKTMGKALGLILLAATLLSGCVIAPYGGWHGHGYGHGGGSYYGHQGGYYRGR